MIELVVPGKPIAKKRPRFARIGKGVRTYSIQQTEESMFLMFIRDQLKGVPPMEGPLAVDIEFHMPRPKGHFGTGKNAKCLKNSAPVHHTTKPDIDNLEKMAYDCLKGVAWVDDCQVCRQQAMKGYTVGDPKTVIRIVEIT